MSDPWEETHQQAAAEFRDATGALDADEIVIRNVGHLAAIMARLPATLPVIIADTIRIDPRLGEDDEKSTITVAAVVRTPCPTDTIDANSGDEDDSYPAFTPAVHLGAVVIRRQATWPPALTVPLPAQQRGEEAVNDGELVDALHAFTEVLDRIATALSCPTDSDGADDEPFDLWGQIEDPDLRTAIDVEATRLQAAARRLEALQMRAADHAANADLLVEAENIIDSVAERPAPDDEPESS